MTKFFRQEEGFTLIELMIVIAVIGVLAVIAVPQLTGAREDALEASILSFAANVQAGMGQHHAKYGTYDHNATDHDGDNYKTDSEWTGNLDFAGRMTISVPDEIDASSTFTTTFDQNKYSIEVEIDGLTNNLTITQDDITL